MKKSNRILFLLSFCLLMVNVNLFSQEICDNAIDDDGDGLIDLNDEDCDCPIAVPLSLIPNPSFEEKNCCPDNRSQLECADGWVQASAPTTDYLHTCGWMGWEDLPPPVPFPDGEGCVGFRNGRPSNLGNGSAGMDRPNWKEYAGACLLSPMKAGVEYRFEVYVGFTQKPNSPGTLLTFFGTPDCGNIPFGDGNEDFGCPLNGTGWEEMGQVNISGTNEWKLKTITLTPTEDIYAVAIGPDCYDGQVFDSYYYFLDKLVLAPQEEFDFIISAAGNPCVENISLSVPERDTMAYQWYYNGVALIGETNPGLENIEEEGIYQVRVVSQYTCKILPAYHHKIPVFYTEVNEIICSDDFYLFGQDELNSSGIYEKVFKNINGCDSIVTLTLEMQGEISDTVSVVLLESETFELGGQRFNGEGEHQVSFQSYLGCDSIVQLQIEYLKIYVPNAFSPNNDGINDIFNIMMGDERIELSGFYIFDRWGDEVFSQDFSDAEYLNHGWDGTINGEPAGTGVYAYLFNAQTTDGQQVVISGNVTLLR